MPSLSNPVNLLDALAMLRRHVIAVSVVCLVFAVLSLYLVHKRPNYTDTGTVAISATKIWGVAGAFTDTRSLLSTEEVMGWYMMSQQAQQQVRAAGGTTAYNVALYNSYNTEYPDYSAPYLIVTTTSRDPVAVENTFNIVVSVLQKNLEEWQLQAGASEKFLITATLTAAPSGPVADKGSTKRPLIGMFVLLLVAVFVTASVLDRRKTARPFRRRVMA